MYRNRCERRHGYRFQSPGQRPSGHRDTRYVMAQSGLKMFTQEGMR